MCLFFFLLCIFSPFVTSSFQGLTNLIILNLYGNPLVEKLENYRIYVVFHLSSLRALDGTAVVCVKNNNQLNLSDIEVMMTHYIQLFVLLFSQGSN